MNRLPDKLRQVRVINKEVVKQAYKDAINASNIMVYLFQTVVDQFFVFVGITIRIKVRYIDRV